MAAASIGGGIGKAILSEGLKMLIKSITAKRYDDAANVVKDLKEAIEETGRKTTSDITWAMDIQAYNEHLTQIYTWFERYERAITRRKVDPKDSALDELRVNLGNDTSGIHNRLNQIDALLTKGPARAASRPGLIKQLVERLTKRLCEATDFDMTIYVYLKQIDDFLTEAIVWQVVGNALRLIVAKDAADMESYEAKWQSTKNRQIDLTWTTMHPFIRTIKKDYFAAMDADQYFYFHSAQSATRGQLWERYGDRYNWQVEVCEDSDYTTSQLSCWKFIPALDQPTTWDSNKPGISYLRRPEGSILRGWVKKETSPTGTGGYSSFTSWRFCASRAFGNREAEREAPTALKVVPVSSDTFRLSPVNGPNWHKQIPYYGNVVNFEFRIARSHERG